MIYGVGYVSIKTGKLKALQKDTMFKSSCMLKNIPKSTMRSHAKSN